MESKEKTVIPTGILLVANWYGESRFNKMVEWAGEQLDELSESSSDGFKVILVLAHKLLL